MIKSARECDQVRRASRLVSNALGAIPGMVLTHMDERSLEAKIDWTVRLQGAEDVRIPPGKAARCGMGAQACC